MRNYKKNRNMELPRAGWDFWFVGRHFRWFALAKKTIYHFSSILIGIFFLTFAMQILALLCAYIYFSSIWSSQLFIEIINYVCLSLRFHSERINAYIHISRPSYGRLWYLNEKKKHQKGIARCSTDQWKPFIFNCQ